MRQRDRSLAGQLADMTDEGLKFHGALRVQGRWRNRCFRTECGGLKVLRLKQQYALERVIDSITEGLIEKDQFTSGMARIKDRIAELDAQIHAHSSNVDQLEPVRLAAERLNELSATIGPGLADADWHRRREILRTLVLRVEIGHENVKVVFRVLPDGARSRTESVAVTLPR